MRPGVEIASPPIPGHTGPVAVITAAAKVGYESPLTTSAGAVDTPLQRRKVSAAGRHERTVEQTLGFAQDSALGVDSADAIEWLKVVEVVDGVLPAGWERTRALSLRGKTSADGGPDPVAARARGGQGQGRGPGRD